MSQIRVFDSTNFSWSWAGPVRYGYLLGGLLGALWGLLGASWAGLGPVLRQLDASWGPFGASWLPLGAVFLVESNSCF